MPRTSERVDWDSQPREILLRQFRIFCRDPAAGADLAYVINWFIAVHGDDNLYIPLPGLAVR